MNIVKPAILRGVFGIVLIATFLMAKRPFMMPLSKDFISCGLNLLTQYHWDRSDDKDFNIKYFSTNGIVVRIKLDRIELAVD